MIPIKDIERVNKIIDRELAFLEIHARIDNRVYVRETFRKLCIQTAEAEGLFKKTGEK